MKVTVKEVFQDIHGIHHQVGDVIEIDNARLKNLEKKGLVEAVTEKPKKSANKK